MIKTATVKWYGIFTIENNYYIELEFINRITGEKFNRIYKSKNKSTLKRIARTQETKFFKKVNSSI